MVKTSSKKKRKSWYNIVAPKQFGSRIVGTTPAFEESQLKSRILQVNLSELTGDHKHQSLKAYLGLSNIKAQDVETEIVGFELNPSTLKRVVKKQKSRGDLSKTYETSDCKVRLKFVYVTRKKASGGVLGAIGKKIDEVVTPELKKMKYDELVDSFTSRKLQTGLKKSLNKIYPLSFCEIRSMRRM